MISPQRLAALKEIFERQTGKSIDEDQVSALGSWLLNYFELSTKIINRNLDHDYETSNAETNP